QDPHVFQRAMTLAGGALAHVPKDWKYPYYEFAMGLAEYRNGQPDAAIARVKGESVLGPCPKIIEAMALKDKDDGNNALARLADAVMPSDWRPLELMNQDVDIYQILRREAQAKIVPQLPHLVDGSAQPAGNDVRFVVLAECQFQGLQARSAQ